MKLTFPRALIVSVAMLFGYFVTCGANSAAASVPPSTNDIPVTVVWGPELCFLFDGTSLDNGDWAYGQVDGVSVGATSKTLAVCHPIDIPVVNTTTVNVLPETGSDWLWQAALALALILSGIGLMTVSRRKAL